MNADLNSKDSTKHTPLHTAVWSQNLEIIKEMLANKAKVNSQNNDGNTPLHIASLLGNLQIIKCLIEKGADIYAKNKSNETSLAIAKKQLQKSPNLGQYQKIISYLESMEKKTKKDSPVSNKKKKSMKKK